MTISEQIERSLSEMASPQTILREVRIYCAVAGNNSGQFPQHVYLARVEDEAGNLIWTNQDEPAQLESGSTDKGFHKCVLAWLPKWRPAILDRLSTWLSTADKSSVAAELVAPRRLVIIASDGDRTFAAYQHTSGELLARNFRRADGKPWGNAAWIAQTLAEAEELGVSISCRTPQDIREVAMLELTQNEAKRRWRSAVKALTAQFA
jgi:hypothetical protein